MKSKQVQALLLSVILVGSVFGGVMALTTPAAAVQDTVTVHESAQGTTVSVANDSTEVFVKVDVSGSGTNGSTANVNVTNGTGTNVTITLYDDGSGPDDTAGDGVHWGSFNVSSSTTDDSTDTLLVLEGNAATVTADVDGDSNSGTASVTTDYTPPQISSATTSDTNGDGNVDTVSVTFTESIDDATSTLDATAFALSTGPVTGVSSGTADDNTVEISTSLTGTSATPDVTLNASKVRDAAGNALNSDQTFSGTADGASPVLIRGALTDRDADGKIDAANLTFSEAMNDSTFTAADWAINSTAVETIDTLGTSNDSVVQLRITTDSNEVNGTDVTGKDVTYASGSVASLNDETLASVGSGDVTEIDEANPLVTAISASNPSGSQIDVSVTAEEQLATVEVTLSKGGSTVKTLSSFTETGSGPYTYTANTTVSADGDYTALLVNASDAAGNDGSTAQTQTVSIDTSGSNNEQNIEGSYTGYTKSTTTSTPTSEETTEQPDETATTSEDATEEPGTESTVTITSTSSSTTEATTSSPGQAGFGLVGSLLAFVISALIVQRRW